MPQPPSRPPRGCVLLIPPDLYEMIESEAGRRGLRLEQFILASVAEHLTRTQREGVAAPPCCRVQVRPAPAG